MDPHEIDPDQMDRLEAPERRQRLPVDEIVDLLEPRPGTDVLDLGCGTGYLARPLAEHVTLGRVVGLDRSRRMIAEMHRLADEVRVRVHGVRGAATSLPFLRAVFSCAVSVNLHHEVDDPDAMLAELVRVLEQGARVLIVDWAPVESPTGPPIEHRVPAGEIAGQLKRAGFEDVESHERFEYHSAVTARRSTRP